MKRIQLLAAALVVVAAMATTARAQDYEAAGKHFNTAQEAYAKGKYGLAVTEYEAAYDITKDPILLYNIAEAHEKSGATVQAVKSYRKYLTESPNASDRAEVEKRIARLDKATGKTPEKKETLMDLPPEGEPKKDPPPPIVDKKDAPPPATAGLLDEEKPSKVKLVAWIGVAVTVALATAGAIFALAAQSRGDEISRRQVAVGADGLPAIYDDATHQQFRDLRTEGKTYDAVAIGLLTAAGVIAVTSGVLFFVGSRKKAPEKKAWIAPTLAPGHAGVAAGWRF